MAMPRQMFQRPGDPGDIVIHINGEKHIISDKYDPMTSLNDYLRNTAGLKGTKIMCNEAGCGCCAVTVTHNAGGDNLETFSINSCLCPLYSTDGWSISTVEGIGNQKDGFHPIQEKIAKYNGTQCGYCTPGFVMSMYGLLHQNPKPTQQEIEDSLDGHICRCTGYRPILDAMKTFAVDASAPDAKCIDIEDLNKKLCPKTGEKCGGKCSSNVAPSKRPLEIDLWQSKWVRPDSLSNLSAIVKKNKDKSAKFIFGNTASGIFKNEGPYDIYVDLRSVAELYRYTEASDGVIFGANTTLTKLKEHLSHLQSKPGFSYFERVVKHLKVLASVLVRNAGCIAGNLMIKRNHPEFPSDLFTMMEAIGASVSVYDLLKGKTTKHTLEEFLRQVDMKKKLIISLEVPKFANGVAFRSFKITPRSQNAHAYVNAAFKIPMDGQKIAKKPSIVFGGIGTSTHVINTEAFLHGKTLDVALIKEAVKVLSGEVHPTSESPLSFSPEYRKNLAINLLYKTLLELCSNKDARVSSGALNIERPLSQGLHTFQEKTNEFPLKQPMPKLTAPLQASGEAVYTNDIPTFQRELCAAFVISTVASGTIEAIDPTPALDMPGVVRFISAEDIPEGGRNTFMTFALIPVTEPEEVFASSTVTYMGQPIGVILAETQSLAVAAAKKVNIKYRGVQEPLVDIVKAVEKESFHGEPAVQIVGDVEEAAKNADKVITGVVQGGPQYYYYLENQIAVAVPSEDGIDVYSASQFLDQVQTILAHFLNKPFNFFNVIGNRIGGSFGGKAFAAALVAAATTLSAYITRRPVRLFLDLETGMKMIGPRFPILAKYKAAVNNDGKIQAIDADLYGDSGHKRSVMLSEYAHMLDQGYFVPNWKVKLTHVKTNKPTVQAMRGPGSVPAALVMESIMEHAAKEINMNPVAFKEKNLYEKEQSDIMGKKLENCTLRDMWARLKQTAEVDARMKTVEAFNQTNTWKKRGLTMTAVKYSIPYFPPGHTTNVSIFSGDGSVTVMTTGAEIGQGLYTKVAQAVAATLGVPIETVKVRPNQNNVTPNGGCTGGSSTSEMCVSSAVAACNQLKEKLQPFKEKMPDADWKSLLTACYYSGLELSAKAKDTTTERGTAYFTYCVGATETEVDVLTGEFQIRRVDIMCDFGESLNPTIDIGQVEGAYVMGLGAYMLEKVIYDEAGTVLNPGTWEYKPPTTKDIPIDWRIHFLPDSPNQVGVLSSKAVGEPPIGLSVGALLAVKSAVENAKKELTGQDGFIPVETPYTVEKIQLSAGVNAATASV